MPDIQPYTEEEFEKIFRVQDKDIKEMLGLGYVPKLFRTAIAVNPFFVPDRKNALSGIQQLPLPFLYFF